jgi:glutathione S-transferase
MVFGQLDRQLVQPELKKHCEFVSRCHQHHMILRCMPTGQQLESHLTKVGAGWFAGGEQPTSADYMMSFPLEVFASADPHNIGPKSTEYIKKIQQRFVCVKCFSYLNDLFIVLQ